MLCCLMLQSRKTKRKVLFLFLPQTDLFIMNIGIYTQTENAGTNVFCIIKQARGGRVAFVASSGGAVSPPCTIYQNLFINN